MKTTTQCADRVNQSFIFNNQGKSSMSAAWCCLLYAMDDAAKTVFAWTVEVMCPMPVDCFSKKNDRKPMMIVRIVQIGDQASL